MRISRFLAGGLVGAVVVATLSGCVGAPALSIYGGLSDRCFATSTTDAGFFALVGVTVVNDSPRSVILRDADVLEVENATVAEVSVVSLPSVYTIFGVAAGGRLSGEQRSLYNDRRPIDGMVIPGGGKAEVLIELHSDDYTEYAGMRGLNLTYDDGWFSATSTADAVVGFVPPWSHCGSRNS